MSFSRSPDPAGVQNKMRVLNDVKDARKICLLKTSLVFAYRLSVPERIKGISAAGDPG